MPKVTFTQAIQRHLACPPRQVEGRTVRELLEQVFADNPRARGYVLDEQGLLRKHMIVFVGGRQIDDRTGLTDVVPPDAEIYVMQALSGG